MPKFEKGKSGNPGGRPKGSFCERCREYAEAEGIDALLAWARGEGAAAQEPRLKLEALKLAIAYGCGKPPEKIEAENQEDKVVEVTLKLSE